MYFTNCKTEAEIKAELKNLYRKWHPDKYTDAAMKAEAETVCRAFTEAYHKALKNLDGTTYTKSDNTEGTYHYNETNEQEVLDKLAEILAADIPGTKIMLIGKYIWIEDPTIQNEEKTEGKLGHRYALGKNGLKLRFHKKRSEAKVYDMWYWKPAGLKTRYNSKVGLDGIAESYGYKEFAGRERNRQNGSRPQIQGA